MYTINIHQAVLLYLHNALRAHMNTILAQHIYST